MKKLLYTAAVLILISLTGCSENDTLLITNDSSDVSFINTKIKDQWQTNVITKNTPIFFYDLSQNALSHSWTISEGCNYMEKFDRTDTDYISHIISDAEKTSTDYDIYVLFQEPGTRTVRLYNTFADSVYYNGLNAEDELIKRFPGSANKASVYDENLGVWVFDTTMIFKVLDDVGADIKVNDNSGKEIVTVTRDEYPDVEESSSWTKTSLGVGEIMTISANIYGEADSIAWKINNNFILADGSKEEIDTIQVDPLVTKHTMTYQATTMSENQLLGSLLVIRSDGGDGGDALWPADQAHIHIPLVATVTAPTNALEMSSINLTDFNSLTVNIPIILQDLEDNIKDAFTVKIDNSSKNISDMDIPVEKVELSSDKNSVILTLSSKVYTDDEITVNYDNTVSAIKGQYDRTLESFSTSDISNMILGSSIGDPDQLGFEGVASGKTLKLNNVKTWWLKDYPGINYSQEEAHSGMQSMKYDKDQISNTSLTELLGMTTNISLLGDEGNYKIKVYIKKMANCAASKISFDFFNKSLTPQVFAETTLDISSIQEDEWVEISGILEATHVLNAAKLRVHVLPNEDGTFGDGQFYMDDISISRVTTRP